MKIYRVQTLHEALDALVEWGDRACILAGGTDVMVQYQNGELSPGALINIEAIEQLSLVSMAARTTLGPLVTHRILATNEALAVSHPALATAAGTVGGWQTQVMGTIGGNICNGSPAADTVPPLLIADAHVTLTSHSGDRRMALSEFLIDRRVNALRSDELLTSIDLEPLADECEEVYLKVGRRGAMEVAVLGLAVRLGFRSDGTVSSARIAVCSVAPTPRRVQDAEDVLVGSSLDVGAIEAAGAAVLAAASPIDDARASASYRRRIIPGLLERAIRQCREEAGQ